MYHVANVLVSQLARRTTSTSPTSVTLSPTLCDSPRNAKWYIEEDYVLFLVREYVQPCKVHLIGGVNQAGGELFRVPRYSVSSPPRPPLPLFEKSNVLVM